MLQNKRQLERYWGRKLKKAKERLGMAGIYRDKDSIDLANKEVQICNAHLKGAK